jgi:hypothetical protein
MRFHEGSKKGKKGDIIDDESQILRNQRILRNTYHHLIRTILALELRLAELLTTKKNQTGDK